MTEQFMLEIITPEGLFFEGAVEELIIGTPTGEMGILCHMAPTIAEVSSGLVFIVQNGRRMEAVCSDGFVRIGDTVTVLLNTCKWPYETDGEEGEIRQLNDKVKKADSLKEYKAARVRLSAQLAKQKIKDSNI